MGYKILLTKEAEADLKALEYSIAKRIVKKIIWLEQQTNPLSHAKFLHNLAAGDIRFRIGDYRCIAVVNDRLNRIEIVCIGHRRDVYR